jgi:hypothetical protein
MSTISPNQLLAELQAFVSNPPKELDPTLQTKLAVAAKAAFLSLEKPEDVVARVLLSQVCFRVEIRSHLLINDKPVEGITIRIAIDLGLFSILKDEAKSLVELVEATKAAPDLLGEFMHLTNTNHTTISNTAS